MVFDSVASDNTVDYAVSSRAALAKNPFTVRFRSQFDRRQPLKKHVERLQLVLTTFSLEESITRVVGLGSLSLGKINHKVYIITLVKGDSRTIGD